LSIKKGERLRVYFAAVGGATVATEADGGKQTSKGLNQYFQSRVEIPRMRMEDKQEIETLIN
jgi:hypothetical protein